MIDPINRALELRKTLVKDNKILVVNFEDTQQGADTSKVIELMPNINTGEKVFRAKINIKEIDPLAAEKYKKPYINLDGKTNDEIEAIVRKQEFDFPLWFKHMPGFDMQRVLDYNAPVIFQVAGCNFNDGTPTGGCWYCYVDNKSNDGVVAKGKTYLSIEDTIKSFFAARDNQQAFYTKAGKDMKMSVLRASGGEPTITLDFILNMWRQMPKEANIFGQIDTNLSTGRVTDKFIEEGIFEPHTLEKLAEYPVKVLVAIKGVNDENLRENVGANATMEDQEYSIRRLVEAGFDIFPELYNPDPKDLKQFLRNMDKKFPNFSRRCQHGPLHTRYDPTKTRLTAQATEQGIDSSAYIEVKQRRADERLQRNIEITEEQQQEDYGVGYKEETRSDYPVTIAK